MKRPRLSGLRAALVLALTVLALVGVPASGHPGEPDVPHIAELPTTTPLFRKNLEVPLRGGLGTMSVGVVVGDEARLADIDESVFEVTVLYELPPAPTAVDRLEIPYADGIVRQGGEASPTVAGVLVLDTSDLELPAGAIGYDITIHARTPSGLAGAGPTRKPVTWYVKHHRYGDANSFKIEAIRGCHDATMETFLLYWRTIFANRTHCENFYPHGTEVSGGLVGVLTDFWVGFDLAKRVTYHIWQNGNLVTRFDNIPF